MFKVYIEKFNIKFQILSQLSSWNGFVCSKDLKDFWLNKTGGKLSSKESAVLRNLSLALRNGPSEIYDKIIFSRDNEIISLRKNPKYKEIFKSLNLASMTLENRILKIEKLYLPISKKLGQKITKNNKIFSEASSQIFKFLDVRKKPKNIELLILLPKNMGYEAWNYYNRLILIPPLKDSWDDIVKILFHEYIHIILFNNSKLKNDIQKTLKPYPKIFNKILRETGLTKEIIAEEMFVSSLIPEGELSNLLFPKFKLWITSSKTDFLEKSRKNVAQAMKPYVVERYQNKITIKDYLIKLEQILKN